MHSLLDIPANLSRDVPPIVEHIINLIFQDFSSFLARLWSQEQSNERANAETNGSGGQDERKLLLLRTRLCFTAVINAIVHGVFP